jgi:outer membrane lipoprotein SlyB
LQTKSENEGQVMRIDVLRTISVGLLALVLTAQVALPASAQGYYVNPYTNPYASAAYYNYYRPTVFTTHPILSGTVVGGAVGALGGAAVGAVQQNEHGSTGAMGHDAAVGAGTGAVLGAGVGLIRNKMLYGTW